MLCNMTVDFRGLKFYSMSIKTNRRQTAERSPDMRTVSRSNSIFSRRGYYYGFMARYFAGYFCCDKCIKPSVSQ